MVKIGQKMVKVAFECPLMPRFVMNTPMTGSFLEKSVFSLVILVYAFTLCEILCQMLILLI